jgi:hypothetical protein
MQLNMKCQKYPQGLLYAILLLSAVQKICED